jgi:hypothetical protein
LARCDQERLQQNEHNPDNQGSPKEGVSTPAEFIVLFDKR